MFKHLLFSIIIYLCVNISNQCKQNILNRTLVEFCINRMCYQHNVTGCLESSSSVTPDAESDTIKVLGNVPILRRRSIGKFLKLHYLELSNCGVSRIYPGALENLPILKGVTLENNKLEDILADVFSNSSLLFINFNHNFISFIENGTFANMPRLEAVHLDGNNLTKIENYWFNNVNKIHTFVLANNQLEVINDNDFYYLTQLGYLDLSFNKISYIHKNAFNNTKIHTLNLLNNQLNTLDMYKTPVSLLMLAFNKFRHLDDKFLPKNVKFIWLHPNPWQCPCLDLLIQTLQTRNVTFCNNNHICKFDLDLSRYPTCTYTISRDDLLVGQPDSQTCNPNESYYYQQEGYKSFFKNVNYVKLVPKCNMRKSEGNLRICKS